ncbi:MAG: plasmid stabilization protein [Hydrogenophilales bacterium CG17_big_fil_post_rev_8_21_14_2_50_63_12]|nr:MAG: plasmid stabilization protein [Hydrogenophilales bacterium CG17_big_fil_post_rev_8_21_14_2_50_63_12]PIX95628.1 MAG: plasmid stabilization protein [Hydrogenophilales bacterium CG_4_10_14_3_um_filter_63_21]PJB02116.1 MAG: plasmid stabilization protein [Hydrogenophilales bacterium CG_4_9_14_3_um_filter_63_34]
MSYQVGFVPRAADDLQRLLDFLAEQDLPAAEHARAAIPQAISLLQSFPFACRKALPVNPFLRELVIEFGRSGYVALYEIEASETVTVLAVRHLREEDFF